MEPDEIKKYMIERLNIIKNLEDIRDSLDKNNTSKDIVINVIGRIKLYVEKFFLNSDNYREIITEIFKHINDKNDIQKTINDIINLINILIEDTKLENNIKIVSIEYLEGIEKIKNELKLLASEIEEGNKDNIEFKRENENIRKKLENSLESTNNTLDDIKKLGNELNQEREEFLRETIKFEEFKQKREVATSKFDFGTQAELSRNSAFYWGLGVICLSVILICAILTTLSTGSSLFQIALNVSSESENLDKKLVENIIYMEIMRNSALKVLFYSMILYLISFFVKNYNAHMHNYIVNTHKANAFSSTLSLIGTAKSDEGNDKILSQATEAIFATNRSGYQGIDSEPHNPSLITNIIDAVRLKK